MKYEGHVRMWQYNKPLDLFDYAATLTGRAESGERQNKSRGFNEQNKLHSNLEQGSTNKLDDKNSLFKYLQLSLQQFFLIVLL